MKIQHFMALVVLSLATVTGARAAAATSTWTGADPSGYWSAPANWSPAGVPVNGNDVVFPGGLPPGDMVSTNDLTDSIFRSITFGGASRHTILGNPITLTNRSNCIINSGTNVIACDLTFSGTPATPTFGAFSINQLGSGGSSTPELTVIGNVGSGGMLYGFFGRLVIRGQFTGRSLRQYGGSMALYGDNPHAVAAEIQGDSSTLFVQGSHPNLNITMLWEMESAACPHLSGDGVVGDVTGCGHITLDSTLSVKNIGRGVCPTCYYNTLTIRLNGTNVGEYGRLVASGDVNLSSGRLLPSAGFHPQAGQVFTIVEKTSPGPITNAFLGPEGTVINLNGMPFRISYVGGDGNDVTLTVLGFVPIPIPGLPAVSGSSVAWGDYDNDGRLDFLLTGNGTGAGSQLWRNTGSGFSNVTDSVAPGLPRVYQGSVAWGDYDNDGRLDLLFTGSDISQLWRNTGSGFSNVTASVAPGLPGAYRGSWGDYDNDGRLDFLLTGYPVGGQLWRNTASGFSNVTASVAPGLPRVYGTSVAWGDYDNDGRLDFLLTGTTDGEVPPVGGNELSQLWRNTGGGFSNVTASVAPSLPGVSSGSMAWGDYDNDGRLDFLLTGSRISQLWRNNMPVSSNTPPAAPTGLSSTLSGATVSLSWNPPADDRTPSTGLNYNVRIGTTPGASDVLAPMALTDGLRLLPALGNAQAGTNAFVFNVAPGRDYYWSVQAVDTGFAGSPFAAEQQFTVAAPRIIELLILGNGHFQFSFSNEASVIYAVLGTTNAALPVAQWTVLGPPVSLGGGLYRFTDTGAMGQAQRIYILRAQ